jgi:inosine-uridine nucleoside N-ribohydrolase
MVFRRALEVIQRHGISWISAEIPHTTERAETSNFDTWKDILKRYSKCTLLLSTGRGSNAISEALGLAVLCQFVEVGSVQGTVMGGGRGGEIDSKAFRIPRTFLVMDFNQ